MTLVEYLKENGLTYDAMAKRIGAHNARTVQRYATAERFPSRENMTAIHEATNGAVTYSDWYDGAKAG